MLRYRRCGICAVTEDIASKLAKIACGGFINNEEAEKARLFLRMN